MTPCCRLIGFHRNTTNSLLVPANCEQNRVCVLVSLAHSVWLTKEENGTGAARAGSGRSWKKTGRSGVKNEREVMDCTVMSHSVTQHVPSED